MLLDKFVWLSLWIIIVVCALNGSVNFDNWLVNVNDATDDEIPSEVTAKIGDDLKIECTLPDYELKFFAWKFCQSDCRSPTAEWKMAVKVDHGEKETFNRTKFDLDPDGSLIVKDIQPSDDHNWVRCFHKERFVGMDHRSTIISVAQEPPVITSDNLTEYVVFESMPFVMFCEVRGYPSPWVAWIWKGQLLQNKSNGPKYLLRHHATTQEAGIYTCMAGNFAGVTSFDYQLTVRVDCLPGELTASPQTHSTVKRSTTESKLTSEAPSAGATRKTNQECMSPGVCFGIGIGVAIAVGIIASFVTAWCVKRRRESRRRVAVVQFQGNSANDDDFTSDDDIINVADKPV